MQTIMTSSAVALLAEGVDRNLANPLMLGFARVALLAEGVDRNLRHLVIQFGKLGRPPRGGRG